jgi:hypothetical protein
MSGRCYQTRTLVVGYGMDPAPGMVCFRPTATQALARGAGQGARLGLGAAGLLLCLGVTGLSGRLGVPSWLLGVIPIIFLTIAGAFVGMVFGRAEGTDVDGWGIRSVPSPFGPAAAWQHVEDLQTERRGGRIRVALLLDGGRIEQLPAPYDGRWLAGDRAFERKLFMLRNLWETHRSFTMHTGFPPEEPDRG